MADPNVREPGGAGAPEVGLAVRSGLSAWDGPEGPRRRALHAGLQRIGRTPADLWHDACLLLGDGRFAATTHLVGHALREIDGTLLALLDPGEPQGDGVAANGKSQKIDRIVAMLGLDPAVRELWRGFGFDRLAHRRAPQPRPRDAEFDVVIEQYTIVLEAVVAGSERRSHQWMQELDDLLGVATPGGAEIKKLTEGIPLNPITLGYFFDRLEHPDWLPALRKKHFFNHPAPVERDEERNTVRYYLWPQGGYLQRIAPARPADVAAVVAQLPSSGNPYVTEAIVKAAATLPAEHYDVVHERVIQGLTEAESLEWVWEACVELIAVLVAVGDGRAVDIVGELLRLLPDPSQPVSGDDREFALPLPEPRSKVGPHEYDDLARACVEKLLGHRPRLASVRLFCDLLTEAVRLSQRGSADPPMDHSSIWRPRIDAPRSGDDVLQALVTATRDLVVATPVDAPEEFRDVIGELLARDWLIFVRLALRGVASAASDFPDLVAALLLDRALFDEYEVEGEYGELLSTGLSSSTPNNRQCSFSGSMTDPTSNDGARTCAPGGATSQQMTNSPSWPTNGG